MAMVPGFNPRTRESATPGVASEGPPWRVSIHALVRVRLQNLPSPGCASEGFNPRTRESATYMREKAFMKSVVSIHALVRVRRSSLPFKNMSTLVSIHALVRVRLGGGLPVNLNPGFNPRTRESATSQSACHAPGRVVSIHALVRVRLNIFAIYTIHLMFQSTHS